jgi:phosphatidylserine/phosphatidylglycerophosphate/cardiolipin synthase-like enzyme
MRALRAARELVYLESRFSGCPEIVHLLSEKLRAPPTDRLRIVVVLPSKPDNGEEDTRGMLAHLADADRSPGRFLAATLDAMTGSTVDQLYVHAKIGIVDDRWRTIGSANLNAHSFFNDTEVNVCDRQLARGTRLRLWSEHLRLRTRTSPESRPRSSIDSRSRSRGASTSAGKGGTVASTAHALTPAHASSSACSARWTRLSSTADLWLTRTSTTARWHGVRPRAVGSLPHARHTGRVVIWHSARRRVRDTFAGHPTAEFVLEAACIRPRTPRWA